MNTQINILLGEENSMKLYRFSHKTGSYGVTIVEENGDDVLVKVEQVIKHPKQGDLHNPTETEGVFFHVRKALSHFEKRYTKRSQLRDFMFMYCAMSIHFNKQLQI